MKILVVDDQPDVVAGILDGVNWRALHVEKAYSALSAAEAKDLHADFPYAQKALQLGAVDYLLQPASYENIEAAIWRAAEQLQEEGLSQVYEALGKSVERRHKMFYGSLRRQLRPKNHL